MKTFMLGGTGRTGRLILERLVAAGHDVTAGGRRDPGVRGSRYVKLDPMDGASLRAQVAEVDVVVSALASGKGNPVCSTVAENLSQFGGLRFVTIGGAGVDVPGDAKGTGDKIVGLIMRVVAREMLADRQRELSILQQSSLKWTMLRPPRLTNDAARGRTAITFDRPATTAIARADLATVAVNALGDNSLIRKAPFVAARP